MGVFEQVFGIYAKLPYAPDFVANRYHRIGQKFQDC